MKTGGFVKYWLELGLFPCQHGICGDAGGLVLGSFCYFWDSHMYYLSNDIGDIGETAFHLAMTRGNLFRVSRLESKWPVVDSYIELKRQTGMFFLVQVKTTMKAFEKEGERLSITLHWDDLSSLERYHAPVFLAGVDLQAEQVYFAGIDKNGMANPAIMREMTPDRLGALYEDVQEFWLTSSVLSHKYGFQFRSL